MYHSEIGLENILYSSSNTTFNIGLKPDKFEYIFISKNPNQYKQEFINHLLMYIFEKNLDTFKYSLIH